MYTHKVCYYETDKMSITHHSNYIRWMEEARVAYLEDLGYPFDWMESKGVISPVVSVECNYKKTTTFPETISIDVKISSYNRVKLILSYTMYNASNEVVCTGSSSHGFLDESGHILRLDRALPEFHEALASSM